MLIELSMNDLIRLYKLASLGKLIGGLVHNLNGPLQNLALDIEMTNQSIEGNHQLDNETLNNLRLRLKRMEEEFERIDNLIKISSMKSRPEEIYHKFLNLNDFLQQELWFLNANLYFKHNVRTELKFQDNPPLITRFRASLYVYMTGFHLHALRTHFQASL